MITLVSSDRIRRIKDTGEARYVSCQKDSMPVVLLSILELRGRHHTLDDVLGVHVEVGTHVEEPRHNLIFFIEFQIDAFEVRICDIVHISNAIALELLDFGYFLVDLTEEWNHFPCELVIDRPVGCVSFLPVRSEIINSLPLVGPGTDQSLLHLTEKLFIPVSHSCEFDIGACFNDGLSLREKHDATVVTISHP